MKKVLIAKEAVSLVVQGIQESAWEVEIRVQGLRDWGLNM